MSVEAITWALAQDIPRSTAKFVLVVLANCAGGDNFLAWPSVAYLAEKTSQDRKTVLANLRALAKSGHISDSKERRGATRKVVVWRLEGELRARPAEQCQKRNSSENGTVPKTEPNSTVFPHERSQKRDMEPTGNVRKTTTRGAQETGGQAAVVVDLIERARVDLETRQAIRDEFDARLAKNPPCHPVSWLRKVIENAEQGEFVSGAGRERASRRREREEIDRASAQRQQKAEDRHRRAQTPGAQAAARAAFAQFSAQQNKWMS